MEKKKLGPTEIDFSQGFSQKVVSTSWSVFKYGRLLMCEGIINAKLSCKANIFENPKVDQNRLFHKYEFVYQLELYVLLANDLYL